ncbi:MAG TPA: ABC transporter ATP-binding protein [Thermoplasmata archaeon]
MKVLDIQGLSFAYEDGTVALKDVSLSLEKGDKVAIVGPNGAGKSTLLHLIAGFRTPFSGTVVIDEKRLDEKSADSLRMRIGLLFQDPEDQVFMPTVKEDVAFGPRNLKMDDIDLRIARALSTAGIEGLANRKTHKLSFGMKKRTALAGVLAMDPSLLLLDEPTAGLDPRARADLISLLKEMDKTMLIATHDIEAVAEVADRALVLNIGVVARGTMRELVMDREVFRQAGLEMPPISKLFEVLKVMGYTITELPVSMDQAVCELTKVIEEGGSHTHAHIHEHDHSKASDTHPHTNVNRVHRAR